VQFLLPVPQRIRHDVERVGDPADFGLSLDLHSPGIIAEPPFVCGLLQLAERAVNEVPGAEPGQDQYERGAQGDQEDAALRAILDLGEGLGLVETKADKKPSGIGPQGREADHPLYAIKINYIGRVPMVRFLWPAAIFLPTASALSG